MVQGDAHEVAVWVTLWMLHGWRWMWLMWASRPHHVVPIVVEVVQVGVGVMVVVRSLLLYDVIGTPRWWWWTSRRAVVTAGPCHVQVTPTERFMSHL